MFNKMMSSTPAPPWLVLMTVLLGTTTVSLNNSALNPALPEFMSVFNVGPSIATWIVAGFMIAMGMTMPITGYMSNKFGKKALYLFGLGLFLCGSTAGLFANNIYWIIAARLIQGIAGGLMIPLSLALIFSAYAKEQRGRITGIWGAAVMLAPAIGPLVGGILLEVSSWRSLFLMNIPVGLLGLVVGVYGLPNIAEKTPSTFDWLGFSLITLAISSMMLLLTIMDFSRGFGIVDWGLLTVSLVSFGYFIKVEGNTATPLLNLNLFTYSNYRTSVIIAVVQSIGMFECLVLLPLLIQSVLGLSPIWTGIALLSTALSASTFVNIGGRWLDSHGASQTVSTGLFITAIATLSLGFIDADGSLWLIIGLMVLRGVGLGLSYMPVTTAGLNIIPEDMVTQGAAMNNISRRITSSAAIVLAAFYLEQSHHINPEPLLQTNVELNAISQIFFVTGALIFITIPLALRMTRNNKSTAPKKLSSAL